ncbi:hypothetical protein [Neotabrizicola sp. sgz301269]|uniref:hypothetical protein n=1 Tax=Neotabrizicola sp. sgz301269 TaxID=3276282 RepID=UPI00376FEEEB
MSKITKPQWVFHSDTVGDWDVYFYSVNAAIAIEKHLKSETQNSIEAIRKIMGLMLKSRVDGQDGDKPREPTEAEIIAFSGEDVDRFSREFLANDKSFDRNPEIIKREDQSDSDFLLRVLEDENNRTSARLRETFATFKDTLGGLLGSQNAGIRNVSEALLKQNEGLESFYGSKRAPKISSLNWDPTSFRPIDLPPNPIHETNERLGDVTERLENLVGFGENALKIMNGLQIATAEFLDNFSTEADKNSKAANKAILVGIFAIVFSIAQIAYTEYWRVPQDTVAMDAALASIRGEIDELQTALGSDLGSSQAALQSVSVAVVDAVQSSGDTSSTLLQSIEQLLRLQQARDQAILEALKGIAAILTPQSK